MYSVRRRRVQIFVLTQSLRSIITTGASEGLSRNSTPDSGWIPSRVHHARAAMAVYRMPAGCARPAGRRRAPPRPRGSGCAAASLMTRVACCGEHTTHSGHPAFLPEYPARVAASLGAAGKEYAVSNFGFPTAVVTEAVSRPAEAGGGKARLYSETEPARLCAAWRPDVVVLGPFGKHDALGPFSTHDT
jgi:hypothetical protein